MNKTNRNKKKALDKEDAVDVKDIINSERSTRTNAIKVNNAPNGHTRNEF